MATHRIDLADKTHNQWDPAIEPVLVISPGDIVEFETHDFTGGQISRESGHDDLRALDFNAIYPLAGPVFVEGAEPGDALRVEILEARPADWGWACVIPGLGLLPEEEFPDPYLQIFDLTDSEWTHLRADVRIPIDPFLGTMGVVPAAVPAPIPPPHPGGGNIDCRHFRVGATVRFPVFHPGGLLSVGDGHAAQGDGEVGISGLECGMRSALRIDLDRRAALLAPQLHSPPGSLTPAGDRGQWSATFGIGPDLMENARNAVRQMIAQLEQRFGLSREEAYILCSLAGDLKITEVVDAPNWTVGCFVPDALFLRADPDR